MPHTCLHNCLLLRFRCPLILLTVLVYLLFLGGGKPCFGETKGKWKKAVDYLGGRRREGERARCALLGGRLGELPPAAGCAGAVQPETRRHGKVSVLWWDVIAASAASKAHAGTDREARLSCQLRCCSFSGSGSLPQHQDCAFNCDTTVGGTSRTRLVPAIWSKRPKQKAHYPWWRGRSAMPRPATASLPRYPEDSW
jgi:hypothetical protein